jgi:hypothetical protein
MAGKLVQQCIPNLLSEMHPLDMLSSQLCLNPVKFDDRFCLITAQAFSAVWLVKKHICMYYPDPAAQSPHRMVRIQDS